MKFEFMIYKLKNLKSIRCIPTQINLFFVMNLVYKTIKFIVKNVQKRIFKMEICVNALKDMK